MSLDTKWRVGSSFVPTVVCCEKPSNPRRVSPHFSHARSSVSVLRPAWRRKHRQLPPRLPRRSLRPRLNRLFAEAEAAFAAKEYTTAVAKIEELLVALGPNKEAPLELLYFNIGLGNLLADKPAEAEAGFREYLKRFPKGEYASRSFLGIGRAGIMQATPEKKERAIEALKIAAAGSQVPLGSGTLARTGLHRPRQAR